MPAILVLNGPNLNLLGQREPSVYGHSTLADVESLCRAACAARGLSLRFVQSNQEGVLIDEIHAAGLAVRGGGLLGAVFNPGALSHTSIALHDAIKGAELPVVEVHVSNIHARESFRQHSWVSPVALGVLAGFGVAGYGLAITALADRAGLPASAG